MTAVRLILRKRAGLTLLQEIPTLPRRVTDALFGYDFFISYAHDDGIAYAAELRALLAARNYTVHLDSRDFHVGYDIDLLTRIRVRNSRVLVVVGRPTALTRSLWVRREVEIFDRVGRMPVIIDVDGAVEAAVDDPVKGTLSAWLADRRIVKEGEVLDPHFRLIDQLSAGVGQDPRLPQPSIIDALDSRFEGDRVTSRRLKIVTATLIVVSALAALSVVLAWVANLQRNVAQDRLAQSYLSLAEAALREGLQNRAVAYASASTNVRDRPQARKLVTEHPAMTLIAMITLPQTGGEAVALRADGTLAVGNADGRVWLLRPDQSAGRYVGAAHAVSSAPVTELDFSPDGRCLVAAFQDGSVATMDVANPSRVMQLVKPVLDNDAIKLNHITHLKDGRLAVELDNKQSVYIFNPATDCAGRREVRTAVRLEQTGSGVADLRAHPDQDQLALLWADGHLALIRLLADEGSIKSVEQAIDDLATSYALAFDPTNVRWTRPNDNEHRIAIGQEGSAVQMVRESGKVGARLTFPHREPGTIFDQIENIALTPDGRRLLAMRSDGRLAVWRREPHENDWVRDGLLEGHPDAETRTALMACCARGRLVATGAQLPGKRFEVKIWDTSSGHRRREIILSPIFGPKNVSVSQLDFSSDGNRLLVATDKGQIAVFAAPMWEPVAFSQTHYLDGKVTFARFNPHALEPEIASASYNGAARHWRLDTCRETDLVWPERVNEDEIQAATWHSGLGLVAGPYSFHHESRLLQLLPRGSKRGVGTYNAMLEELRQLGDGLIAYHYNELYYFPNIDAAPAVIKVDDNAIAAMAVHHEQVLVTTNNATHRFVLKDGKLVADGAVPCAGGTSCGGGRLAIAPSGAWFAATQSEDVILRDMHNGKTLARLDFHRAQIEALAIAPDSNRIASGSLDGVVSVWNVSDLFAGHDAESTTSWSGWLVSGAGLAAADAAEPGALRYVLTGEPKPDAQWSFNAEGYASDERPVPQCKRTDGIWRSGEHVTMSR